jgi:non-ribosomal peptide synthetase component F
MHHVITDGWSMNILFDELGKLYDEQTRGKPAALSALSIQYSDFAQWQREHHTAETLHADVTYWTSKLRGHSGFINWPADRPRPHIQSHEGATETFQINTELTEDLSALAKSNGATLFMVLLAALQTLVLRYTSSNDILIGVPIAGRNDAHLEKVIGCFVNTLVIRGDLSNNPKFVDLLQRTRETTIEAYNHQHLAFEKLVEALKPQRNLAFTPLFQIMFVFQNTPKKVLKLPGLSLEELEFDAGSAKFDLTLEVVELDGLHFNIEYCTALFRKETIRQLVRHFEHLLADIIRNSHLPISKLQILDNAERQELIVTFNSTEATYRRDARIDRMFEEQAGRTPDRIALVDGEREISYRDLSARANALARLLVSKGCNQRRPVGIYMERSIDAVAALLAALKANAPYVPLDISNPPHRLELLILDAGCGVILTHRGLNKSLPNGVETIPVDQPIAMQGNPPDLPTDGTGEELAYIIYTSGSTGAPKGVEGSHRAAINRITWMWRTFPFVLDETCCHKTALGFVDSVWEIFGPLLGGVRVVIVPGEVILEPDQFVSLLSLHDVTRIVLVPSLLRTLLDVVPNIATRLQNLKLWSASGEILHVDLARRFRELLPAARLLNIYVYSKVNAGRSVTRRYSFLTTIRISFRLWCTAKSMWGEIA